MCSLPRLDFRHQDIDDIKNLDFWSVDSRFITSAGNKNPVPYWNGEGVGTYSIQGNLSSLASGDIRSSLDLDSLWIPSDSLAKSLYSTILVDLGQINAHPNILTDEDALHFFSKDFVAMQQHSANAHPGPAQDSYNALKAQTGPLEVSPSVIATRYVCQVPKQKSRGTLFVSILVADLVLLQAFWKLFSMSASGWHTYKYPQGRLAYVHFHLDIESNIHRKLL